MEGILEQAIKLPIPDRIKLVEDIWDSIAAEPEEIELTSEQAAELQRRIDYNERYPGDTIPWEVIKAEALARR